jgi:RNA polymerase sigma factor (sigma-70 family)
VKAAIQATTQAERESTIVPLSDPFERLFAAEYPRVVAIAHRVLGDRAEAEDVAQEVFLDYHRRHDAEADFAPAWLHRAAAHGALNRVRSRQRRQRREAASLEPGLGPPDPQHLVVREEGRRQVRQALARLPQKPASALALRYSGLSYVEIGNALGVGVSQIGTLLRRAEKALRKEIDHASPE